MNNIFKKIDEAVARLNFAWGAFETIFNETPEREELLNQSAQFFFKNFYSILSDYIILKISCLTDPPPSNGDRNKDVLSLVYLLSHPQALEDKQFLAELENKYKKIQDYVENLRKHRSKRIAHTDQNSAFDSKILPSISKKDVSQAINAINDFMQSLHFRINGTHKVYDHAAADGGATELLGIITDGLNCRDLALEEKISPKEYLIHRWRDS